MGAPSDLPPVLFHYTTYQGLIGIVESRSLWASSARHLNDATEYEYTLDLVQNKVLTMPRGAAGSYGVMSLDPYRDALADVEFSTVFVASFTTKGDLLSQWRAYGGNHGGIAIGFNTRKLAVEAGSQNFSLKRCIDNPREQLRILKALHNEARPQEFVKGLLELAPKFKHPSFNEESEWRLLIARDHSEEVKFRVAGSLIVPYTVLRLNFQELIHDIVVGPCRHPNDVLSAVKLLMHENGISYHRLRLSKSPFRAL
jgi:Protein of unknown function (DUF2971)